MNLKAPLVTLVALLLAATLVIHFFGRQLASSPLAFGVHPDVLAHLESSLEDQKRLAQVDPDNKPAYRRRFESIQALVAPLRILHLNRLEILDRYEKVLLALVAGVIVAGTAAWAVRQGRQEARLARLQAALAELAAGRTDLALGDRRRDVVGRIAAMVEETSRAMARDRRRLASLENLSAWQEAARRHAHEMRTPLTAARLELVRLRQLLAGYSGDAAEGAPGARAADSVLQELDRLGRFTDGFTSFARLPRPRPVRQDLAAIVAEFVELFATAWPNLDLRPAATEAAAVEAEAGVAPAVPAKTGSQPAVPAETGGPPIVRAKTGAPKAVRDEAGVRPAALNVDIDREMLRQVLVNLCDNSSLALGERRGVVTFALAAGPEAVCLEVADDGPGIAPEVRARLFEPYTTTRGIGEGMGLGLAISRKILLDHGGDLELARTGADGTTFRLTFPRERPEVSAATVATAAAGGDAAMTIPAEAAP